jgi:hypothetical protein
MRYRGEQIEHFIEIDESLKQPATGWTIQRIGWTCFVLVLICVLLGFFGNGILSHRKAETSGNMVEYERYGRFKSSTSMHFKAGNENGQAVLCIPQEYLKHFELERITPEPDQQKVVGGHHVYTFLADAPVHILLRGVPKKRGAISAKVKINRTEFSLSQFIFP